MLFKKDLHRKCITFKARGVSFGVNPCIYHTAQRRGCKTECGKSRLCDFVGVINLFLVCLIPVGFSDHLLQKGSEGL